MKWGGERIAAKGARQGSAPLPLASVKGGGEGEGRICEQSAGEQSLFYSSFCYQNIKGGDLVHQYALQSRLSAGIACSQPASPKDFVGKGRERWLGYCAAKGDGVQRRGFWHIASIDETGLISKSHNDWDGTGPWPQETTPKQTPAPCPCYRLVPDYLPLPCTRDPDIMSCMLPPAPAPCSCIDAHACPCPCPGGQLGLVQLQAFRRHLPR